MKLNLMEEHAVLLAEVKLKSLLKENISIGAFDEKSGQLVGIRLSFLGRNEDELTDTNKDKAPLPFLQIGAIVNKLFGGSKAECLGTKDFVYFYIICTKSDFCGRGIASELYRRSHIIAAENGCTKTAVVATSYYTQRIIKKFDYKIINSFKYEDYVDPVTGSKVLSNMSSPHVEIMLGVKDL